MKVLQFGKYYPPNVGGMERAIFNITEGLNQNGIQCDVLCSNPKGVTAIEQWSGYKVYRIKSFGELFSMAVTPGLITWLRKLSRQYDIIHFHHPDPLAALALFLTRPKCKVVVHWHLDIIKQKTSYMFYKPLEKWLLNRADKIICTSPNYSKTSVPLQPVIDKVVVVPLGIDAPEPVDVSKANQYRVENRKVVFALGRFTEYKGFEYLIRAAQYLDDNFMIWIGGGGPLKERFEQIIAERNLGNKVKLLGKISDEEVTLRFAACDAFCLSSVSRNEAFGLVILEAMSQKKPVIATKVPGAGMSWINVDGVTGVNVEPADAKALADGLVRIFADKNKMMQMGEEGRKRLLSEFTVERMVEAVTDLYTKL